MPLPVPGQAEKGEKKSEENSARKPGTPVFRPGQNETGGKVGVDRVLVRGGVLPVGGQELACHFQGIVAVMLEASPVEMIEVIERCVVMFGAPDKGKVETVQSALHEDSEVRGVGHCTVARHVGRTTHGTAQAMRHLVDHPGIALRGFKHETAPGGAPGFEIEDHADALGGFVEAGESQGPGEAQFLPVGEEENHGTGKGCFLHQDTQITTCMGGYNAMRWDISKDRWYRKIFQPQWKLWGQMP